MERKGLHIIAPATQQIEPVGSPSASKLAPLSRGPSGLSYTSSSCESLRGEDSFLSYHTPHDDERRTVPLKGKLLVTFGRDEGCDVCVSVPTVSRNHAQLRIDENNQAWIENLSDINPTKLNGERLTTPTSLKRGDSIELGGVSILYGEHAPPPSSGSSALLSRRASPSDGVMQPLCVEGVSSASAPGSCESESGAGPSTNPSSSCSEDTETGSTLTYEGGGYEGSGLNFTRSDSLNLARSDSSEVGGFGFIPSDMSMIRADSESLMRGDSDAFTDSQMLSSTMPIDDGQEDDGCIIPAVSSTSSPHGSRLLSRKIRSQNAAKAQLAAAQRQLEAACATPPPPLGG